ncbi:MAG: SMI1/KNR4 family protein [Verrucomicrobia bacterium]|nr:SMI1/KNR4 family protein [Verrucomicrobiota bacterium]
MDISEIEEQLKMEFPKRHRQAMLDSSDPIRKECDFLVPSSSHTSLQILHVNEWLHSPNVGSPWPDFLVAFASNGCGDYFAYDIRHKPYHVIYIDPDDSVEENLDDLQALRYESFEKWYEAAITLRSSPEYKALFGQ